MIYDLTQTTFVIPVEIDCPERMENLTILTNYLNKYLNTNILVVENSPEQKVVETDKYKVHWLKREPEQGFNRSIALNTGFELADTPVVVNQDVDVFVDPILYKTSQDALLAGDPQLIFMFPYDGNFYNLSEESRLKFAQELDIENVDMEGGELFNPHSNGGVVMASKEKYRFIGYENPNFAGWGYEDHERLIRAQRLGFYFGRTDGTLYHLPHPRVSDFYNRSNPQELNYIQAIGEEELRARILSWAPYALQ